MPIDFPSSPTTNQTYTYNNKIWVFNGSAWVGGTVVSLLPAGSMQMYAGAVTQSASAGVVTTNSPSGWLLANGNIVSRTTYSALFTAIGTTYGAGDGSTTFALPDMRSRIPISVGTGSGLTARTLGGTVGAETHTLASGNIPQMTTGFMSQNATHTHNGFSSPLLKYVASGGNRADLAGGVVWIGTDSSPVTVNASSTDHTHTVGTASPTAVNHIPPALGLNFIIKT